MGKGKLKVAGRLGVGMFLFCCVAHPAAAQVLDQSKTNPATPQAQPAPAQPNWIVSCASTQAGLYCSAAQSVFIQQAGRNVRVSAALRITPETKKPNLVLQLPLGVDLRPGVKLQFGGSAAKALPFESCDPNGCVAEYPITDAEIVDLTKGADLTLSVQTPDRTPFTFKISAAGFAAAYAKTKSN